MVALTYYGRLGGEGGKKMKKEKGNIREEKGPKFGPGVLAPTMVPSPSLSEASK